MFYWSKNDARSVFAVVGLLALLEHLNNLLLSSCNGVSLQTLETWCSILLFLFIKHLYKQHRMVFLSLFLVIDWNPSTIRQQKKKKIKHMTQFCFNNEVFQVKLLDMSTYTILNSSDNKYSYCRAWCFFFLQLCYPACIAVWSVLLIVTIVEIHRLILDVCVCLSIWYSCSKKIMHMDLKSIMITDGWQHFIIILSYQRVSCAKPKYINGIIKNKKTYAMLSGQFTMIISALRSNYYVLNGKYWPLCFTTTHALFQKIIT